MAEERRVCVTGAGGFVASWLVKLLLSKGFTVHGTVRDPGAAKNAHLKRMENSGNLKLFKADVLDYESLAVAVAGCEGVFHAACPVLLVKEPDPEAWYDLAKTLAEEKALEYSKSSGLDVVVICPSLILGPFLQPTINESSLLLLGFYKGKRLPIMDYHALYLVDIRDVVDAALLIYEKSEASGRYICCPYVIKTVDFCDKCKRLYPNLEYPDCSSEAKPYHEVTSAKLKQLGWNPMSLEESIRDTIEDFVTKKLLDVN